VNNFKLPEVLNRSNANKISEQILTLVGSELSVDASSLRDLSAMGLEMLISSKKQWQQDGLSFEIINWPEAILVEMSSIGFDPSSTNFKA
jgi:anti-anti-sigma regulatory factor